MQKSERLLGYLQEAVKRLLDKGRFQNGREFRPTQREALEAYKKYLAREDLSTAQKLKGYFEIPTGVGKTAMFVALIGTFHQIAKEHGENLRTIIVVPTLNLISQTQDEIYAYAPLLKKEVGLYGGAHKNLKLPITIMTYDAWSTLSAEGTIGSHNTDILISDEAHRGTSDARIVNIKNAFNGHSTQIAFTATAHFDTSKSVQTSHEREIYYKSAKDAISKGELAAYIQSQIYVIRAEPPKNLRPDLEEASEEEKDSQYRRALKQAAWNKRAVVIYRDGHNWRTGELLTENQAGFFVDGIRQANRLEEMLNKDPELQKRAKAQGCDAVAVAIHSSLPDAEQERRFKAYKKGHYMAVIGDEKFKEGFDHQPMKTIIDYQHSSLVDKMQIIGRGLRKWHNSKKGMREEGLTFIDTVTYVGSRNSEKNRFFRDAAIRRALTVRKIFDETYVLGPAAPPVVKDDTSGGIGGGAIFIDDKNVEEYATLEDTFIFSKEQADIGKEDWIEITPEIYKKLQDENKRTGLAGDSIFDLMKNHPEGLTANIISNILFGGTKYTSEEWIKRILLVFKRQPDKLEEINISPELNEIFKKEQKRTGIKGGGVFSKIESPPQGMKLYHAVHIVSGERKKASQIWIDALLTTYKKLPDAKPSEPKAIIPKKKLTDIYSEATRTGLGGKAIFRLMQNPPEGLTGAIITNILCKNRTSAPPDWIERILETFQSQTDLKIKNKKPLPQERLKKLQDEAERTGLTGSAVFHYISRPPEGLTSRLAKNIVAGKVKNVSPEHTRALFFAYNSRPTKKTSPAFDPEPI